MPCSFDVASLEGLEQTSTVPAPLSPSRVLFMVGFFATSLCACEDRPANLPGEERSPARDAEESPSARILPEPLEEGAVDSPKDDAATGDGEATTLAPKKREPPRPFPIFASLSDDDLRSGVGTGFEMEMQLAWPEAKRSVRVKEEEVVVWPTIQVQLLREGSEQVARMRMILQSSTFPLPMGSEIRARADRLGYVIVWPDRRSYRVAPPGSLHAIFSDRRVDRTPFVEPQKRSVTEGKRLGKPTRVLTLGTLLAEVRIEFVEVKELPFAAPLLCGALLELARIRSNQSLCSNSELPVHFEMTWASGEKMTLSTLSWGAVSDLVLDNFRTPPDLPIFKRGELPPSEEFFFAETDRFSLLPLTKTKAPPAPASATPQSDPQAALAGPKPLPKPGPPKNEVFLENTRARPVVVFLNRIPLLWLGPAESKALYVSEGSVKVAARSFLGEVLLSEVDVTPPAKLDLGGPPKAAAAPVVPAPN